MNLDLILEYLGRSWGVLLNWKLRNWILRTPGNMVPKLLEQDYIHWNFFLFGSLSMLNFTMNTLKRSKLWKELFIQITPGTAGKIALASAALVLRWAGRVLHSSVSSSVIFSGSEPSSGSGGSSQHLDCGRKQQLADCHLLSIIIGALCSRFKSLNQASPAYYSHV